MSTFDVRDGEINEIVFATQELHLPGCIATHLSTTGEDVYINDSMDDYLWLKDKEHALNLIKALNKAIELGWLK